MLSMIKALMLRAMQHKSSAKKVEFTFKASITFK